MVECFSLSKVESSILEIATIDIVSYRIDYVFIVSKSRALIKLQSAEVSDFTRRGKAKTLLNIIETLQCVRCARFRVRLFSSSTRVLNLPTLQKA